MSKLYFDVTHLLGWKGNLTGIPRTTDEIARRLLGYRDVVFVTWDKEHKTFLDVDMYHFYEKVEPKNRTYFKDKPTKTTQHASRRPFYIRFIRRVLHELPFLSRLATRSKRMFHREVVKSHVPKEYNIVGKSSMVRGDMLCIPCGVWDDKYYINAVLAEKSKKVLVSFICYDLLPIVVPQFSGQWGGPMSDFTRRVTAVCDLVFSISEYTKNDLEKWLTSEKLPVPRIEIMKLGDAFVKAASTVPTAAAFKKSGISETKTPFILCIGTVEARKNHTLLYYTYKLAKSRGIELPQLVIAGRRGHRTDNVIDFMHDDPDTNEKITMLFDTTDGELSWLYQQCTFTIYPSFYEGWGLPIAESIAQGVPCLSSNTSSMTEVAPGFVDYFSPYSPDDCLRAILEYMDPVVYKAAKQRARGYKPILWDDSFQQMREDMRSLSSTLLEDAKS